MKSSKLWVAAGAVVVGLVVTAIVWKRPDRGAELCTSVARRDLKNTRELLTRHPGLVNVSRPQPGNHHWTPLHIAAYGANKPMVELLLSHRANINAKDNLGATPLHLSTFVGNKELAEYLVVRGADVNAKGNDGRTALDLAKLSQNGPLIEVLRRHKAKE